MANDLQQPVPKKTIFVIAFVGLFWLWYKAYETDQKISSPAPGSLEAAVEPAPYSEPAPAPAQPIAKAPTQLKLPSNVGIIKKWSGSGSMKTEPFVIDSDIWAVTVGFKSFDPGMSIFICNAFRPGESAASYEPILTTSDPKGALSFVYKSGTFALDINSANCDWVVVVHGEKPK